MFEVNDLQETLPCANAQLIPAIHYNYSNHTATIPILLMSPASAMTVCVTLQATPLLNGTASYYLYSHAHILNFSFEIRHNIPCTLAPPPGTTCFLGVVSHPLSPPPHLVTFLSILIFRTSPSCTRLLRSATPQGSTNKHCLLLLAAPPLLWSSVTSLPRLM